MKTWTEPLPDDMELDGMTLVSTVPPERWPYGPPDDHQHQCMLFYGGLFCDCNASATEVDES